MTPCFPVRVLRDYLNETQTEATAAAVTEHLSSCGRCQGVIEALSDDPAFDAWVEGCGPRAVCPWSEQLGPLISKLGDTLPLSPCQPDFAPSFLDPPQLAGDLGTLGPYRVRKVLGRGGMGMVLEGYDPKMQRPVALKVLLPQLVGDSTSARLAREAHALAQLRDEHVVTVHSVELSGRFQYLVMELLTGPTLADYLREHSRLQPREAATICLQVASGLTVAHRLGLVHRDIKPGNVKLDIETEKWKILDFGLVRNLENPTSLTAEGRTAGTPEYMSPEQLQSPLTVGPSSDQYSLGVVLYELLTGERPFQGSPQMLQAQVVNEEPVSPRRLDQSIPRDLETICLKAMSKTPKERYATAKAFAEDLRRFLAGLPVLARPVGRRERLWRWCRRNPRVALLSLSVALSLVAGTGVSTFFGVQAERRAKLEIELRKTADEERRRSEENLRVARATVMEFCTNVANDPRLRQHDLEGLRRDQLRAGIAAYEKLAQKHSDGPEVLVEQARAYVGLAHMTQLMGNNADAPRLMLTCKEILERAAQSDPNTNNCRSDLAIAWMHLGNLFTTQKEISQAEDAFNMARSVWEALASEEPSSATWPSFLAQLYINMGVMYGDSRRPEEEEQAYLRAREILERNVADPNCPAHELAKLATCYNNLGALYHDTYHQPERAIKVYEKALELRLRAAQETPQIPERQHELAMSHLNLGNIRAALKLPAAQEDYQRAIAIQVKLLQTHPSIGGYRAALDHSCWRLGDFHEAAGRTQDAIQLYEQARSLWLDALRERPEERDSRFHLSQRCTKLASLYHHVGRLDLALERCEQACNLMVKLQKDYPVEVGLQQELARAYYNLGSVHGLAKHWAAALEAFDQAAARQEKLVRASPDDVQQARVLSAVYHDLLKTLRSANRIQELDARSAKVMPMQELLRERFPSDGTVRDHYFHSLWHRAESLKHLGRYAQAIEVYNKAWPLAPSKDQTPFRINRLFAISGGGDHARAFAEVNSMTESESLNGAQLTTLAAICSQVTGAAAKDTKLKSPERTGLVEKYATRAVELLSASEKIGYFRDAVALETMKNARVFDALRSRADYRKLLETLGKREPVGPR